MKNTKKTSSTIQSIIQAVLNGEERVFCCRPNQGRPTLRMSNLRLPFTYFPFKSRHIIFVWRFYFILFRTNTFCGPNHKNTDWNDGYTSFHHSSCFEEVASIYFMTVVTFYVYPLLRGFRDVFSTTMLLFMFMWLLFHEEGPAGVFYFPAGCPCGFCLSDGWQRCGWLICLLFFGWLTAGE